MLPFWVGFACGAATYGVVLHFALVRKLRDRVAYLEDQFKSRFAQII
jgi:hypothetical protein